MVSAATGRSLAVEDRDLAVRIGQRLRAARLRAGLTQREVSEGRYSRAYVSALECGQIKPSMAALRFLAGRIGTTPADLLADGAEGWSRLEADLRLAAGDWQRAADAYVGLLDGSPAPSTRAELLLGLAESLCRLDRPADAIRPAAEARELFGRQGRPGQARLATYWLAAAHHQADDPARARLLLEDLLSGRGDELDPDLHVRALIALAMVLTHAGEADRALMLLSEARGLGADLDDRRRATLLFSLALGFRSAGDTEAAIRAGLQGLALYRAANAASEAASIENELALIYLELGNLGEAERYVGEARQRFEDLHDRYWLAHVTDTQARVALARGDTDRALELGDEALGLAREVGSSAAEIDALVTRARAHRRRGDAARAIESLEAAADRARTGPAGRLRSVLAEWADLLAASGDHARAYELTREALSLV
ncbi:MAG TPA: helix-turn-helix transcriptional regulator [Candidatus Dormibacteraeota bacterium]|nr:helix-turn-helix transcriptional regulator [Candidatus Dormibacteraeota bacterium]